MKYYYYLFVVIFLPSIDANCNHTTEWFNENSPSQSQGHEIERFSLIRAKYPWKFELNRWTGSFEIRAAPNQNLNDTQSQLIHNYTRIYEGLICHAVNGKQCVDYEIRFCMEYNACGQTSYPPFENRIVGGIEARPHSFPWLVSIQYKQQHICGGTLLDNQHILTAAHCVSNDLFPMSYSIALGAHNLSDVNQTVPVQKFVFHPDFDEDNYDNDVAVIKLQTPISSFTDKIQPTCLLRSKKVYDESGTYLVAGWGAINEDPFSSSSTNELRQIQITIMKECSTAYPSFDSRKQICAGSKDYTKDSCKGDSGGGLFEKLDASSNQWFLIGIVSFGRGCAYPDHPGVYIRVNAYYQWIQSAIARMR